MNTQADSTFQGFTIPERNYFLLPNEWIDICAEITNLAELKVILYVLRHTWGYQEYNTMKTITIDEFMHGRRRKNGSRLDKGTGLSNRSVIEGIKRAIEHKFLICTIDDTDKARTIKSYALHMMPNTPDVKNVHSSYVDSTHQLCRIYTPDVKNVHSSSEESTHRSEKDTLERHLKKDTLAGAVSPAITNKQTIKEAAPATDILSVLKNLPEEERQHILAHFQSADTTLPAAINDVTHERSEEDAIDAELDQEQEKLPEIAQKPPADAPRTAETVVLLVEFLRGMRYSPEVRSREKRAAQKLLYLQPTYSLTEIEEAWVHGSDDYWRETHSGQDIHVHDLVNQNSHSVIRIQAFLEHKRSQERRTISSPRRQQQLSVLTPPVSPSSDEQKPTMSEAEARGLIKTVELAAQEKGHTNLRGSVQRDGEGWIVLISWQSSAWKGDLALEIRSHEQWSREFSEWDEVIQLRSKRKRA